MAMRIVVLLIASLALAVTAQAACELCQVNPGQPWWGDGTCQPSYNGRCSYWCCLSDPGAWCSGRDSTYGCSEGLALMPSLYFASKLPLVTEGSALRFHIGPAKPVQKDCAAVIPPRRKV